MVEKKFVEYKCTWCGKVELKPAYAGRPNPGNCPRKPKMANGKMKPHTWTISRKI